MGLVLVALSRYSPVECSFSGCKSYLCIFCIYLPSYRPLDLSLGTVRSFRTLGLHPSCKTSGLKRKKFDEENDHLIPSTPEINKLMKKAKEITGLYKYCFTSLGGKNKKHLGSETINDHFKNLGWKDKQSAHQWRSVITTSALERSDFGYEIIDRQLGRMGHLNGTRGHYDRSTLLDKRREFMEWWSKTLIEQGLKI